MRSFCASESKLTGEVLALTAKCVGRIDNVDVLPVAVCPATPHLVKKLVIEVHGVKAEGSEIVLNQMPQIVPSVTPDTGAMTIESATPVTTPYPTVAQHCEGCRFKSAESVSPVEVQQPAQTFTVNQTAQPYYIHQTAQPLTIPAPVAAPLTAVPQPCEGFSQMIGGGQVAQAVPMQTVMQGGNAPVQYYLQTAAPAAAPAAQQVFYVPGDNKVYHLASPMPVAAAAAEPTDMLGRLKSMLGQSGSGVEAFPPFYEDFINGSFNTSYMQEVQKFVKEHHSALMDTFVHSAQPHYVDNVDASYLVNPQTFYYWLRNTPITPEVRQRISNAAEEARTTMLKDVATRLIDVPAVAGKNQADALLDNLSEDEYDDGYDEEEDEDAYELL